jgi:hypothetical protein
MSALEKWTRHKKKINRLLFLQNVFREAACVINRVFTCEASGAEIFLGKRHRIQHPFQA